MEIMKSNFFLIAVLFHFPLAIDAQHAITPIDRCLLPESSLGVQILSCQAALDSVEATAAELTYLPPVITELRGDTGNFDAAYSEFGKPESASSLILSMAESQHLAERYDLAMSLFQIAETDFAENERVLNKRHEFLGELERLFSDDPQQRVTLATIGLRKDVSDSRLRCV